MNVALIFAGGTGQRMHAGSTPKQFLQLHGKPIIAYTLDVFQKHTDIDAVVISCLEAWIPQMKQIAARFGLDKVVSIVPGGETGQNSIFNGLAEVHRLYKEDVVVLVHDGVRPLVDAETISRNLISVQRYGNAITTVPAIETIVQKGESEEITNIIDRHACQLARAPQSFRLKDLLEAHKRAIQDGRNDFIDSACLMRHYGYTLYAVEGNPENIKITTPIDYYMFRAVMEARETGQVFG